MQSDTAVCLENETLAMKGFAGFGVGVPWRTGPERHRETDAATALPLLVDAAVLGEHLAATDVRDGERAAGETGPAIQKLLEDIESIAALMATVLILGETGVGKELVARALHEHSGMRDEPFIAVDCTAIPETLLESSLFGHVAGAFTGAKGPQRGRFEMAGREIS